MAEPAQDTSQTAPSATDIASAIVSQVVSLPNIERLWAGSENTLVKVVKITIGVVLGLAGTIGAALAEGLIDGEDIASPAFERLMRTAFRDITGVDMGGGGARIGGRDGRAAAAKSLGAALMEAVAGASGGGAGAGGLEPSRRPAENYVTWVTQLSLEGWLTGAIGELVSLGLVENLGDLDDSLAQSLGLGRMTRRVMGPLLDAKVITPFKWEIDKLYRPQLLAAGEVARQVARGRWTREQATEELARQGYSADRIEALLNAQRKFFSAGDVRTFAARAHWTNERALQHLKDQGYTEAEASDALRLEGLRRIDQLEDAEANAIIASYARGDIDGSTFRSMLGAAVTVDSERALLEELADVRRALNVKRLSPAEAKACVRAGVLSVIDYRRALEREGYEPDAVIALELLLRHELDERADVEELRRQAAEQRAQEQAARAEAAATRRAEIDAARALQRRGPIGDLERAAVRGIIPLARLADVLAAQYDADTVAILVELVEQDRLAFLEQQKRREEAAQRVEQRGLSIAQLERAVLERVVSIGDYRARLEQLGIAGADVDVLAATLDATVQAREDAQRKRAAAVEAASARRIDLSRFEQLVRRGARSIGEYDRLIESLGFDDAARAAMRELLELRIADDDAARREREAAAAKLRDRGLSLEQLERAVLLGVRTVEHYDAALLEQGFNADARVALIALLRDRLIESEAARARRQATADPSGARDLPLATARRAARLGILSPDTYAARVTAAGYGPDDVAIELELLLLEIANTQAQRATRDGLEADADARGLALSDVKRAVMLGVRSLEDYRAAAVAAGYVGDALDTLAAMLAEELAQQADARARREQLEAETATRELGLGQLAALVREQLRTLDDYFAGVLALGYSQADAELLTELLATELEAAAAKAEG